MILRLIPIVSGRCVVNVFGKQIKEEREKYPMTVELLANLSGLSEKTISGIENGTVYPNVSQLFNISKALGKKPGHFFTKLI